MFLLLWRAVFDPRPGHVRFVMDKVAPAQVFLNVLVFPFHCRSTNATYSFFNSLSPTPYNLSSGWYCYITVVDGIVT